MIIAATGHRPHKLGGYNLATRRSLSGFATDVLRELHPDRVISGMAQGWDQAVAVACIALDIPFIAAVPCPDQEKPWPPEAQDSYRRILDHAAEIVTVSPHYSSSAMLKRDKWMVDAADQMLALWDGNIGGGTANTIAYAEKRRVPVTNVWATWQHRDLLG